MRRCGKKHWPRSAWHTPCCARCWAGWARGSPPGEGVGQAAAEIEPAQAADSRAATILARKAANRAAMKVSPPTALPQLKLFGRDLRGLKSRRGRAGAGEVIKGVACSPGSVTATARVMH